ncbi:hypothetical protein Tsubulata_044934 [Turnera subulata]|uniref:SHSP domain-containing protein n=1 Tax=Turnera subulata TaxID=218843 RepID=A0A9Q0GHT7_9ROSI|nr:hypothetical protein Tsubulata_044934 [Turnera subulata]
MEGEAVKRRVMTIAAHFAPCDDISPAAAPAPAHLLPMHCSSSLNSVIPRFDNRTYFARQSSASQGFFMRQAEEPQGFSGKQDLPPIKCPPSTDQGPPLFSRPANFSGCEATLLQPPAPSYGFSALDIPNFARPTKGESSRNPHHLHPLKESCASRCDGNKWSPRMDVVESRNSYILTVEIPGVSINDIRVEIRNQNLTVMGKRYTHRSVASCSSVDSISAYHRREIIEGPYNVVWSLPSNVNKDGVSAEFQ